MKRLYLPLILLLFVVLEGVALDLLPIQLLNTKTLIVPHWVLIILIFIVIFYDLEDTYYSILYGIIFGLLIDIVYTGILGIYMFSYGFGIYLIHELKKFVHTNFYMVTIIGIIGLILADIFIHTMYSMIGYADVLWSEYILFRLVPTILANLIILIVLYPFLKKWLTNWSSELSD